MLFDSIQETVSMAWLARRTQKSSSGWISGNAVCCIHRGETVDKRGRGGFLFNSDGSIHYNCFNCHFTASYTPGWAFSHKFINLLTWMGFSDTEIGKLRLINLKTISVENLKIKADVARGQLPERSQLLATVADQYPDHVNYLKNRGFDLNSYNFHVTDSKKNQMNNRVILPLYRNHTLVGYTARAIVDISPKYHMQLTASTVFGANKQKHNWSWCPVSEGPFDALAVDGLGMLGNEVNETQVEIIKYLGIQPVVVADNDFSGQLLIDDALSCGWSVSFPEWPPDIKDLNDAVLKYGKLFVLRHIWKTTEHSALKIKVKKKLLSQVKE